MKKIDTSHITGDTGAPVIKETLEHYNEAIAEGDESLVKALHGTYTPGDLIILHGCEYSDTIPGISSVTAGAIYYNGEIYQVDADASIETTGSETLVWEIETTYPDGEVIYSDGSSHEQHQVNKMVLVNGLSGSGIADYDSATVKTLHRLYNKAEQSAVDLKANIAAGAWTAATLFGGVSGSVQYRVDSFGMVHLRGYVQVALSSGATDSQIVSNMGGKKPANSMILEAPVVTNLTDYTSTSARCIIGILSSSSTVTAKANNANISASDYIILDGISFWDVTT